MSVPGSACADAARLLAGYKAAIAAYGAVQAPCFQSLVPEHITHTEACRAKENAFSTLRRVRRAYWQHVEEHQCQPPVGLSAQQTGSGRSHDFLAHLNGESAS